jgi:uncharacterized protein
MFAMSLGGHMTRLFSFTAFAAAASLTATAVVAQVNLTAETASPGGSAYLAPSHLTEVAAAKGIANIQLADGQTLTNSVQNVAEGKTDIATTPFILPFLMSRGVGPYASLGKEKGAELASNMRVLYSFSLGAFFMYAFDSKGVDGWQDLKGRKVFNGPPRGAALNNSRSIVQIITGLKDGEGYEGVQANWGQATSTINDGTVDAVVLPELFPSGRIVELGAAGNLTAWSIPKDVFEGEAMQKYMSSPGNAPWLMTVAAAKAGLGENWTVVSEDDTFRGMSTVGGDTVNKNMDEELVYKLVKAHIDTLDQLKAKAPFASTVGFGVVSGPSTGMCGANPLKFHKGAVRAWEEAGYKIDDCAKE